MKNSTLWVLAILKAEANWAPAAPAPYITTF